MTRSELPVNALNGARLVLAGVDALASARTGDRLERSMLEILASRQVIQLSLTIFKPSRRLVAAGAAVDALHSLSMIGLATASPAHRRGALEDALVAGALSAAGVLISLGWHAT